MIKQLIALCVIGGLLTACASQQTSQPTGSVKVGKPYVVLGKKYYPEYDSTYDKVGVASWYGPGFHGKYTANGELFDQNDLTAAHPTLPMPSLVRVTNMHNGKSAIIRVNDRGPFKDNRIIDLSKKSAQRLGINGLAKVRVQFLQKETEEYMTAMRAGQNFDMFAYNDQPPEAKIVESTRYSSSGYDGQAEIQAAPVMTVQSAETTPIKVADTMPAPNPPAAQQEEYAQNSYEAELVPQAPPVEETAAQPVVLHGAPSPAAGPIAEGDYTIQAGVFSSESNARKLADKLSQIALASLDTMESMGKTLWRVRIGSFTHKHEAEQLLANVRSQGNVPDARIVRR